MPTAILDIDLADISPRINGLDGYEEAFILVRYKHVPLGQLRLPVVDNAIAADIVLDSVRRAFGWQLARQILLNDYLELDDTRSSTPLPGATVAIITRDRPEDLRRCLDAILSMPDDGAEIMVIDNCPATDQTRELIRSIGHRVRYIREDQPGASAARNRALREAQHEIVAFSDDDAIPDRYWLRALLRNFEDPLVFCVTGLVLPAELETAAQHWFEAYSPHGRGYTRVVYEPFRHDVLMVSPIGVSASVALRKSVLELTGGFVEALGPGTPTKAGEDTELFTRIMAKGCRLVYEPRAVSWHRHRRTWPELRRAIHGYGIAVYAHWTHALLVDREYTVPRLAWGWFWKKQAPDVVRALFRRPGHFPLDLLLAELWGCVRGPFAYAQSRRRMAKLTGVSA